MTRDDVEALRSHALSDASILHVIVLGSFFNYLNRVADAIDLEFDYESPLPRMVKDAKREPLERPPRARWSTKPVFELQLSARPKTFEAFKAWRAHLLEREAPLSRRDRKVLVRAVAEALADARTCEANEAEPKNDRERALASYATTLTAAPWRLTIESVQKLRALSLDDAGILDVVTVASHQNTASRLTLLTGQTTST